MAKIEPMKDVLAELRALQDKAFEDDSVAMSIEVQNYHNNHNYPSINDLTVIRVSLHAADFDKTFMSEAFYSFHTTANFRQTMERINEHYNRITKKL